MAPHHITPNTSAATMQAITVIHRCLMSRPRPYTSMPSALGARMAKKVYSMYWPATKVLLGVEASPRGMTATAVTRAAVSTASAALNHASQR